jgi:AmpD protein
MRILNGWVDEAKKVISPNFNERPEGEEPSLLVIHNISLPPGQYGNSYIEDFFLNKLDSSAHPYFSEISGMEVSSHFLIKRSGELVQFVGCDDRAWHAGRSSFCGRESCNDFSIGIELEGQDIEPYTDIQYQALADLTRTLMRAYPLIEIDRLTGHSDIAPGRKTDPGESFDWARYKASLIV